MSGDELARPEAGTAAGVPFVALPPTAVDAGPRTGPSRMIVAWHGLDPPRTESAFAAALPMTGVPAWRVFLGLPMTGARLPAGGLAELAVRRDRDYLLELLVPIVEQAAGEVPEAIAELRERLGLADDGPVGLAGFSAGATAALLTLAEGTLPVGAAALIAPVARPARVVSALERRSGTAYSWNAESHGAANRLDFTARAAEVAERGCPLLLIGGDHDELVPPADTAAVKRALDAHGARKVEAATFRMGHALAVEPGTEPAPPIAEAVSVDGALTDWFRRHLCD